MRKGVPLTNREKRGRNQHENVFFKKKMKLERITGSYFFLWVEAPEALHCEPRLRKCSKVKKENIKK